MKPILLAIGLLLALVGAWFGFSVGVSAAATKITHQPTRFISRAMIRVFDPSKVDQVLATLESEEIKFLAIDRIRALYPMLSDELPELEFPGGRLGPIVIVGTGSNPAQVQAGLDCLLAEAEHFLAEVDTSAIDAIDAELKAEEKRLSELTKEAAADNWTLVETEKTRLESRLIDLRTRQDDLNLDSKLFKEGSAEAAFSEKKLGILVEETERVSHDLAELASRLQNRDESREAITDSRKKIDHLNSKMSELTLKPENLPSFIIVEPASLAIEIIDDWTRTLHISGGVGAFLGLLPGLLLSVVALVGFRESR